MAELTETTNLCIPRVLGSDLVMREKINLALERIDVAVLPVEHQESKAHFELWKPKTTYKKQDMIRTKTCPSWGVYMCSEAGTSGAIEPAGYGEGDVITDGSTKWVLKSLGGGSSVGGAPNWLTGLYYQRNSLAIYNNLLYRCLSDHQSTVNFDKTKWEVLNIGYLKDWQANTTYEKLVTIITDGKIYRANTSHISSTIFKDDLSNWELLANAKTKIEDWKAQKEYEANECVVNAGYLYRSNTAHISTNLFATDIKNWQIINITRIESWQANKDYSTNEMIFHNGFIYRAKQSFASNSSFSSADWELLNNSHIPNWQAGTNYEPTMTVIENSKIYRSKTVHTATNFASEINNWEQIGGAGLDLWKAGSLYCAGDIVIRNGIIYQCMIAH